MNKQPKLCGACHGTSNALTRLVMIDGHEVLVDPAKAKAPAVSRYEACQVCGGTGVTTPINKEVIELLCDLADMPPEFLPDQEDEEGMPVENPDFDGDEVIDHLQTLIERARAVRDRWNIPETE